MTSTVWGAFIAFVIFLLMLDLLVLNRGAHVISAKRALTFTGMFIALALAFAGVVYAMYEPGLLREHVHKPEVPIVETMSTDATKEGVSRTPPTEQTTADSHDSHSPDEEEVQRALNRRETANPSNGLSALTLYLTGWMLEYALSVDNIFVIALVFKYFAVPAKFQHRVLFWGILGAMVMRGVMIGLGAALVHSAEWVLYIFGAFLIYTAIKMAKAGDQDDIDPSKNPMVRLARKVYPVSQGFDGQRFFTRITGPCGVMTRAMTPLFLVLLVVETTDVVFAVDSIPAIFGVTSDPFLVFTSNVFAILGLRSLYFALSAVMDKFRYLKTSLVLVLAFIGLKMLLPAVPWLLHQIGTEITHDWFHISPAVSLSVVASLLAGGVLASVFISQNPEGQAEVGTLHAEHPAWTPEQRAELERGGRPIQPEPEEAVQRGAVPPQVSREP